MNIADITRKQLNLFRRADMAHSPSHRAIFDMEEKRSNLFPDRRRVPGRKAKFIIAAGLIFQGWGIKKLVEIKQYQARRGQDTGKLHRKTAPFFQAVNDLQYCSLEDRNTMVINELFASKGKDYIKYITQRFHNEENWTPYVPKAKYMYNATSKNVKPYMDIWFANYMHGYDNFNI